MQKAASNVCIKRLAGRRIEIRLEPNAPEKPLNQFLGHPPAIRNAIPKLLDGFNQ